MTGLNRVTITGADDSISAHQLKAISAKYPFVEWGILFSMTQQGQPRFPSERWIEHLPAGLNYSAHLCGRYVRDAVLEAKLRWIDNPYNRSDIFKRMQLNFHGQFHKAHESMISVLGGFYKEYEFIFQCDGVNDKSVRQWTFEYPDRFAPLFDTSGGAGRLPEFWPTTWGADVYCGYAGGLGPDNIVAELEKIEIAALGRPFWVDMERRVRSDDDSRFDLGKVERVLELCVPYVVPIASATANP